MAREAALDEQRSDSLLKEFYLPGRGRISFARACDRWQHDCCEHKQTQQLAPNSSLHAFDHLSLDTADLSEYPKTEHPGCRLTYQRTRLHSVRRNCFDGNARSWISRASPRPINSIRHFPFGTSLDIQEHNSRHYNNARLPATRQHRLRRYKLQQRRPRYWRRRGMHG